VANSTLNSEQLLMTPGPGCSSRGTFTLATRIPPLAGWMLGAGSGDWPQSPWRAVLKRCWT